MIQKDRVYVLRGRNEWIFKAARIFMIVLIASSLILMLWFVIKGTGEIAVILGVVLNTLVAALGFYAIYLSLQNDKEVKQYEFYADYNFNFLTNDEFIEVERKLESCNQEYLAIDKTCSGTWSGPQEKQFQLFCDSIFGTQNYQYSDDMNAGNTRKDDKNLISNDYQKIVNYLVYLESFVPLILHGQLKLEEIDDLFGYRYFIAMNNPVLQENELFRERPYYRGCFKAYEKWKNHRHGQMPMSHYDLLKSWPDYKKRHPEARE